MDNVKALVEFTAKKMGKPFNDNILDELLMSYNIKYTAVEIIILIKSISENLGVNYVDKLKRVVKEGITYDSIIKIFSSI